MNESEGLQAIEKPLAPLHYLTLSVATFLNTDLNPTHYEPMLAMMKTHRRDKNFQLNSLFQKYFKR